MTTPTTLLRQADALARRLAVPVPVDAEEQRRRALEAQVLAACKHPTALADPATYNATMETAWDLWPYYDLVQSVRLAHLSAVSRVRRMGGQSNGR